MWSVHESQLSFHEQLSKKRCSQDHPAIRPMPCMCVQVSMQAFLAALKEVKPAFGAVVETLDSYRLNGITNWGPGFEHLAATCRTLVEQVCSMAVLCMVYPPCTVSVWQRHCQLNHTPPQAHQPVGLSFVRLAATGRAGQPSCGPQEASLAHVDCMMPT